MKNVTFKSIIYLFFICSVIWSAGYAQEIREILYQESLDDFANPERGFYHARELTNPQDFDIRSENITLIYGRISADDFRDRHFSDEFLQAIQAGFDEARKQGIKVNPRVAYNRGPHPGAIAKYGDDAPKHIVLQHIAQLKPIWHKNKDVINVLDAGFIGGWGEWHTSAHGLDSLPNRREILFAILDALPADRMVVQRAPHYKRAIFTGSEINDDSLLTKERAFDGSYLSRVGHLNDCFLSSDNDVGTYAFTDQGWPVEKELTYIGAESRFVPFGGETCRLDKRGTCENAISEMEQLHINYLNIDYNQKVLHRWKEQGCFEQISRRLGYRFVLKKARIPQEVYAGGHMEISLTIENKGFAELFNPRKVEMVLFNNHTKAQEVAVLSVDPRFWSAGERHIITTKLSFPARLSAGTYSIAIRLPDSEPSIHDDSRYAIRFANKNTWQEKNGTNILTNDLIVSTSKSGENRGYKTFSEIR